MDLSPRNINIAAKSKQVPNFRRVVRDICGHCKHLTASGTLARPEWWCAKHNLKFGRSYSVTMEFTCSDWEGSNGSVGDLPIPGI